MEFEVMLGEKLMKEDSGIVLFLSLAIGVLVFAVYMYWPPISFFFDKLFKPSFPPLKKTLPRLKMTLPRLTLPEVKFKDSGWVLLYRVCGWICFGCAGLFLLIGIFGEQSDGPFIAAVSVFFGGLSCFFAAHILRLQEKAALYAERSAELMEKNLELTAHHAERTSEQLKSIAESLNDNIK